MVVSVCSYFAQRRQEFDDIWPVVHRVKGLQRLFNSLHVFLVLAVLFELLYEALNE